MLRAERMVATVDEPLGVRVSVTSVYSPTWPELVTLKGDDTVTSAGTPPSEQILKSLIAGGLGQVVLP